MNEKETEYLLDLAKRLDRIAGNIEIQWDGMHEFPAYADVPLDDVLCMLAEDIIRHATGVDDGAAV